MKRFFVIMVSLFAVPAVAFAAGLPDYPKDGKLIWTLSCDAGKAVANGYYDTKGQWDAYEYRLASGDVFVEFFSGDENDGYHIKLAGSTEMKKVSHNEWDAALKAKSLAVYNFMHDGATDCK